MVSQDKECIRELLCEARSGSRVGTEQLAVIVRERMYPFVLRAILDPDAAEAVVQETLLSVLMQLDRLRENQKFWPWVCRITLSKIRDHIRRRRLHSAATATLAFARSGGRPQDGSVLDAEIHAEKLRQVSHLVDQLSYHHRDIIRLRFYEQLSYAQIASRTRMTPKMARARSYRAKQLLKAYLV